MRWYKIRLCFSRGWHLSIHEINLNVVITGKYQTEVLTVRTSPYVKDRPLIFSRDDQAVEVNMRFIIWLFKQHTLHIRIVWYWIDTFNVVVLVVIAFMKVKLSFRLFIVRLIHDLVLNLLNSLNFCSFSKFPFVVPLWTKWLMKPVIWTGPIRKLTDRHVTRLSQSKHSI